MHHTRLNSLYETTRGMAILEKHQIRTCSLVHFEVNYMYSIGALAVNLGRQKRTRPVYLLWYQDSCSQFVQCAISKQGAFFYSSRLTRNPTHRCIND
ncbi:hypothetical protein L2E82_36476 [Cichorium intybus]|uniref:Uncharacterized protein n=1 Tax=Cichorium intybus TaxID=13427 RepID=A0ACB9BRU6_CICIN|nr:hypothetical protein L2E82_36476 [Cichorium intybus]